MKDERLRKRVISDGSAIEMQLFTDLPNKIKLVEAQVEKSNVIPYLRTDTEGGVVTT